MSKSKAPNSAQEAPTGIAKFFAYSILILFLLILAAATGRLILWILGIEL